MGPRDRPIVAPVRRNCFAEFLSRNQKLELDVLVFALVKLNAHGRRSLPAFAEAIRGRAEVQECFTLMGDMDFLLRIVVRDVQAYERFFFETLSQLPGVQEVHSNIAMSEMKSTTSLPLQAASAIQK